ncbi:hypothetical protein PISMIDRAFT_436471 [Pisolithus microcarpus 441]|uniref:Unplaced genomic scaffold scaffold_39, whole genome shotgun sequence n=1 Tax=Pisolithus microcarpus 441 TaxID=765257 RepID=A0A0C9YFR6_9AGAM|nr:hypothetical protein BKA83DRAFT_436471 [Pisolithus microcarpus]KIK23735.1 hypothetical protein PISMIDRAFT_436471 [Pisolithus microcarpus 441]
MVDVVECPGCCDGPYSTTTTFNDWCSRAMPGLMMTVSRSYLLRLDGKLARVDDCSGQQFALGDYGDYSDGNFVRTGNIFAHMRAAGMDREDPINFLTVISISSSLPQVANPDDLIVATDPSGDYLFLHQPRAFSLAANEPVSLLLKASSTSLTGKHLVTAIIQCSDFYTFDEDGNRRDLGDNSAPVNGNHSTETRMLTPLCAIASPQVWRRESPCIQRMARFKSIREHFDALVDMHQSTCTAQFDRSANKQKKDIAIKFFSDLFGLKYLKNHIGKITFFKRFPSMTETSPTSDVPAAGGAGEDGLRARISTSMGYNPFRGGRQFAATESDPRLKTVLPLLHRRCQTLYEQCDAPRQYAHERRRVEGEIKSISRTLGADLVEHIRIVHYNAYPEPESSTEATHRASTVKYDRQLDTLSVVQDIKALQAQLDATEDEDEQRALEEDIAGKILWLFWCGICGEADELLPKVVEYIRREVKVKGLLEIYGIATPTSPSDDQAHLQRIMYDAGANTSKHQLWLDARARGQAKWSGDRGIPAMDDQGTTPSTSRQTPVV